MPVIIAVALPEQINFSILERTKEGKWELPNSDLKVWCDFKLFKLKQFKNINNWKELNYYNIFFTNINDYKKLIRYESL